MTNSHGTEIFKPVTIVLDPHMYMWGFFPNARTNLDRARSMNHWLGI